MKRMHNAILSAVLLTIIGCGEEPATVRENTVLPPASAGAAVTKPTRPVSPSAPISSAVPDELLVDALISDVKRTGRQEGVRFKANLSFTLSHAEFSGGYSETLDLENAESFEFRSKYNKNCDKSTIKFSSLSPTGSQSFHLEAFDDSIGGVCMSLFANIKKDMRVVFTNVPLVINPNVKVPRVVLHMIP